MSTVDRLTQEEMSRLYQRAVTAEARLTAYERVAEAARELTEDEFLVCDELRAALSALDTKRKG